MGFVNIYSQRTGISVAVVCFVNHTGVREKYEKEINSSKSESESECHHSTTANVSKPEGEYIYSKSEQGHILSGFFYGYIISQIPGGRMAEIFGGKRIFALFTAIGTIGTLLTPLGVHLGFVPVLISRILVGFGSGAVFPIMHAIWGQWAPPMERSKLVSISYAGAMMGSVLSLATSGALCEHGFAGGWPSIFYITGITSALWLILWIVFVSDSPSNHRFIGKEEQSYIIDSLKGQVSDKSKKSVTPWTKFIRSPAVLSICFANFTSDWGLYTFLTVLPTFLNDVLKFDLGSNGLFSALPWVGLWANMNISPIIADYLISSNKLSVGLTRKLMTSIGAFGAAICLIGIPFTDCSSYKITIALLVAGVTLSGCQYSGFLVNHMDIAPKYAGTLFGISNMIGAIAGVSPSVVGLIRTNVASVSSQWMIVFFLSAALLSSGAIVFIIFGSGDLQPWAKEEEDTEEGQEMINVPENGRYPAEGDIGTSPQAAS
ncbi:DgyrCDS13693 [Dimorphilus gyrociliatus]|uniref:DgyrCDS13693 n=1 Tax=Dimorphilus gyrociliatus TaxID=2664684 RepID=A0A7I8WBG9_9ANNE|nr:DgyrCDS13693 [Dimorphilus gyrociliatus]